MGKKRKIVWGDGKEKGVKMVIEDKKFIIVMSIERKERDEKCEKEIKVKSYKGGREKMDNEGNERWKWKLIIEMLRVFGLRENYDYILRFVKEIGI